MADQPVRSLRRHLPQSGADLNKVITNDVIQKIPLPRSFCQSAADNCHSTLRFLLVGWSLFSQGHWLPFHYTRHLLILPSSASMMRLSHEAFSDPRFHLLAPISLQQGTGHAALLSIHLLHWLPAARGQKPHPFDFASPAPSPAVSAQWMKKWVWCR